MPVGMHKLSEHSFRLYASFDCILKTN